MSNKFSIAFVWGFLFLLLISFTRDVQPREKERAEMVRTQILGRGITHKATLNAMQSVPRHLYVPSTQQEAAYQDRPLPIGFGQTISQPYIVAYSTQTIQPRAHHKVLEIGTGSGYQAAVLAEIVKEVYTIEIIPELAQSAAKILEQNYNNVFVKSGDGYNGWPEHAPFDAIIVTAAPEQIPQPLIDQLKDGGRMVIPVGSPYAIQELMLVEKNNGKVTTRSLLPVRYVPFEREE